MKNSHGFPGSASWSAILAGALCIACGSDPGDRAAAERTDSAGIEIVAVHAIGDSSRSFDTHMIRIGSDDAAGNERTAFEYISDLIPLADGRLAIIDNRGARVAVFASSGEWLYDIGRRGEGPGEYTGPIYGSIIADTLFMWDQIERRMSMFLDDGTFIDSSPVPAWTSASRFAAIDNGFIRQVEWGQHTDPAPARAAIVRTDRTGTITDTLSGPYAVPEYGATVDPATGYTVMVNPPALAVAPPWTTDHASLAQLDPINASVAFRDHHGRGITRMLRLPFESHATTPADRDAFIHGLQSELGMTDEQAAAEREATTFADVRPALAGILIDDRDRIWVAAHDAGAWSSRYAASTWTIWNPADDTLRTVRFPPRFQLRVVRSGRAYGLTTLESGVHVVDVFDMSPG